MTTANKLTLLRMALIPVLPATAVIISAVSTLAYLKRKSPVLFPLLQFSNNSLFISFWISILSKRSLPNSFLFTDDTSFILSSELCQNLSCSLEPLSDGDV